METAEAIRILKTLAAGVDPHSGPHSSPKLDAALGAAYQHVDTVRALYGAADHAPLPVTEPAPEACA